MDKKNVKKILADMGVLEADLAKMLGITIDKLNELMEGERVPEELLQKIEKTLNVKNLFYMPEYGNNNVIGASDNKIVQKLLEAIKEQNNTIKEQNNTIKELRDLIDQFATKLPDHKTRNKKS